MSTSRMPPPGAGSGPAVVIGIKPATKGADGKMPPPGAMDKTAGDGKVPPEQAGVIRSDSHCIDCTMYDPTSGDCSKVAGSFDPQDACSEYFQAIGDDTPPDSDDAMTDNDGDETGS